MPNILIIGATGYIGEALALSLLRSGSYTVYGLARSSQKATSLAALEITPILAPDFPSSPGPVLTAITEHHIDTVVVAGGDEEAASIRDVLLQAGRARLDAASADGSPAVQKLGFVYTSGTWVHGSSRERVSDLVAAGAKESPHAPAQLTAWRAEFEREILKTEVREVLDVLVVRPALVYGRTHAIWSSFFKPVLEAAKAGQSSVQVPLERESRPSLIHVDDVASGLHAAVEKLPLFSGTGVYPVFDLSSQSEGMQDVFDALAKAVGFKGKVELVGAGDNLFARAMSTSANNQAERAKSLLSWSPKRAPFVDGMEVYAKAFIASV